MNTPSVSVCFPAYNEQPTIRGVVENAHRLLRDSGLDYEILACDDGSADQTGAIITELSTTIPMMRVLRNIENQGIFATFERLYAESTKEFVFLNSTDGQWDTRVLLDLLHYLPEADVVIASRRQKHYGLQRRIVSALFNLTMPLFFGTPMYDAGAVKLMRREIIVKYPVVSKSPFVEAERLVRAARAGYRIADHPVDTAPRRKGKAGGARMRVVLAAGMDVGRVWLALRHEQRLDRDRLAKTPDWRRDHNAGR